MNEQKQGGFPQHNISPKDKNKAWIMQFVKAAWDDFRARGVKFGYNKKYEIEVIKNYAQGNQSITKYKPLLEVSEDSNDTWLNIDWSIIPIVPKFRKIAISKMMANDYNIVATPIDSLAQDEASQWYIDAKTKVMMREIVAQQAPQLLEAPAIEKEPGDPIDMEELEMQAAYTYKHKMATEAEQGIKLIFEQNDITECRKRVFEELFDTGVAGYREWIDENNKIRIRPIRTDNLIVSFCKNADFSDKFYAGEIIEMTIADLRKVAGSQFSEDDYKEIATKVKGEYGNPTTISDYYVNYSYGYDRYKVRVLDIEFYSVNDLVYEERVNRRGNLVFGRASYDDQNKVKDKFKRASVKVVYKAKWIIGTDLMFDFGLCTDMKRAKSSISDTEMSFHIRSSDFYDMRAVSKMEQMIPVADAIQLSWYKLQNAINQSLPGAWDIDLDALEDIPLGSGGKKLDPKEVITMFFQRGLIVSRRRNMMGANQNGSVVNYIQNNSFAEVGVYWNQIQSYIQLLRDITGLNELTDGSTPNPRTLTTVAKMAGESSNNAMGDIAYAERRLIEKLAENVILRLQDVVQRDEVYGYVRALGNNSIEFVRTSENISLYEFGIMIESKPTDEQKMTLLNHLEQYRQMGLIEPEDDIMIRNTNNLKVAEQLLAYRVKKRKLEKQAEAMQAQQMNGQIQQQSAMAIEQAKQQTMQMEFQMKMELEKIKGQIQMQIASMKIESEAANVGTREAGRVEAAKVHASSGIVEAEPFRFDPSRHMPIMEDRVLRTPQDQALESEKVVAQEKAVRNIANQEAAAQQQEGVQPGQEMVEPGMEEFTLRP